MLDLMDRPEAEDLSAPSSEPNLRLGSAGEVKPKLRGWIHALTVPLLGSGIIVLICLAPGAGIKWALAVYLACAIFLFGNSGAYHIGNWSPRVRATLRRVDHSNIYLFVAGTYTALSVILLSGSTRILILSLIWGIAALGIVFSVFWITAPRWLTASLYVLMGWAAVWWLPDFVRSGGWPIVILVILGGVLYSAGALVYALKKPNPSPTWFGFHEFFHSFTVAAAFCHYAAIAIAVSQIM